MRQLMLQVTNLFYKESDFIREMSAYNCRSHQTSSVPPSVSLDAAHARFNTPAAALLYRYLYNIMTLRIIGTWVDTREESALKTVVNQSGKLDEAVFIIAFIMIIFFFFFFLTRGPARHADPSLVNLIYPSRYIQGAYLEDLTIFFFILVTFNTLYVRSSRSILEIYYV